MRRHLTLGLGLLLLLSAWELVEAQFRARFIPASYAQGGDLSAGDIVIRTSGDCGSGFSEVSGLDGKVIRGTVAANMDQGGTGGSDTVTPEGTVSQPTFTGTPFTDVINHTHTVDIGSNIDTNTSSGAGNNFAGTTSSVQATTANPSGGVTSITPAGSVSVPTFTGTQHSTLPAYTKVIFCSKN